MDVHNKLREIRREKDVTQQKLATALGVSRQTIITVEKGHVKRPSDELMLSIANYFDLKVSDIFLRLL